MHFNQKDCSRCVRRWKQVWLLVHTHSSYRMKYLPCYNGNCCYRILQVEQQFNKKLKHVERTKNVASSHRSVSVCACAVARACICISEWPINFRLVSVHAYSIIQKHILSNKPRSIERNTRFGLLKFISRCKENTKPQFDWIKTIEIGLNSLSISNAH